MAAKWFNSSDTNSTPNTKNFPLWELEGFAQLKELQMVIYEKLQKKWSFWFKIGINYEISYLEPRLLLPPIAQLVEHQTSDQDVMSSSLTWGSILFYARLCTVISHCVNCSTWLFLFVWCIAYLWSDLCFDDDFKLHRHWSQYIKTSTNPF